MSVQESGVVVDERQVAQLITMLANNYNSPKGGGDDGDLSTALTNSLFSSGEGQVRSLRFTHSGKDKSVAERVKSRNAVGGGVEEYGDREKQPKRENMKNG